jgi:hypothetical protein
LKLGVDKRLDICYNKYSRLKGDDVTKYNSDEAQVYLWEHQENIEYNKTLVQKDPHSDLLRPEKYIGANLIKEDRDYKFSSEDYDLKKAYNQEKLTREILFTGNRFDCWTLENKLLMEGDGHLSAKNNSLFFNHSNGGGIWCMQNDFDEEKIDWFIEKIQSLPTIFKPLRTKGTETGVEDYEKLQERDEITDSDHLSALSDQMMDLHGNLENWDPVYVLIDFEQIDSDGKLRKYDLSIFDGIHTTVAAVKTDNSKECPIADVPTRLIPKELHEVLNKEELKAVQKRLNPQISKPSKSSSKKQLVKELAEYCLENEIDHLSDAVTKRIRGSGFTTKSERKYIIKGIREALQEENNRNIPSNCTYINYKGDGLSPKQKETDKDFQDLEYQLKLFRQNGAISFYSSGGHWPEQTIMDIITNYRSIGEEIPIINILVSCPNEQAYKTWNNDNFKVKDNSTFNPKSPIKPLKDRAEAARKYYRENDVTVNIINIPDYRKKDVDISNKPVNDDEVNSRYQDAAD